MSNDKILSNDDLLLLYEYRKRQETERQYSASFREFISIANPRYTFYKHCEYLIDILQRVADGEIKRLMVFMPPRHGKSELVSRLFPAYYLMKHPRQSIGLASYSADLAYDMSRAARNNFIFGGGKLNPSSHAVGHWQTNTGGEFWAAGVGGSATGKGWNLGIIDDPYKNAEEAASRLIRGKVDSWYDSVWHTRAAPDAARVIVNTRWHQADLSGRLLQLEEVEPEYWYVVSLPAIAEPLPEFPPTCTVLPDWRNPGEALNPERYDIDNLKATARRVGSYTFNALYQQRPAAREGGMFNATPDIVDQLPSKVVQRVWYWDKAGSDERRADYTVGVRMAQLMHGKFAIEKVVRFQLRPDERNARIREVAELDRALGVRHYIEQPPGDGVEATQGVIRALRGFAAYANPVRGDKISRADPYAAVWSAGDIILMRGAWNRDFLDEHRAFPHGANDDQVDAASGAFQKLISGNATAPVAGGQRKHMEAR